MPIKENFSGIGIFLLVAVAALGGNIKDGSKLENKFVATPEIITVKSANGMARTVCVGTARIKGSVDIATLVVPPTSGNGCFGKPGDALKPDVDNSKTSVEIVTAKFEADPNELGTTENNEKWLLYEYPSTIYFKTVDAAGKEQWDAFCAVTIFPDAPYTTEMPPKTKFLTYKRNSDPTHIDSPKTPVTCDGIQFALKNQIPREKPKPAVAADETKLTRHSPLPSYSAPTSTGHSARR